MRILFLSHNKTAHNPLYNELEAGLTTDPKNRVVRADFNDYINYFETTDRDKKQPLPPEVTFIDMKEAYDEQSVRAILLVSKKVQTVVYVANTDIWQRQALRATGMLFVGPHEIPKAIAVISAGRTIDRPSFDPLF
jgi:hypothetical protein